MRPTQSVSSAIIFLATMLAAFAQGSAFTYQGRLTAGGSAANGQYEMSFTLFDAGTNGSVVGSGQTIAPVVVSNGLFTVTLDFGASAFNGGARWLEISVNLFGSDMIPTVLAPRQRINPTPYAIHAANAAGLMSFAFEPLDIKVNGERALRLEPTSIALGPNFSGAPNVIGGSSANAVGYFATGATIAGGGAVSFYGTAGSNFVESPFATIGGGMSNSILSQAVGATIAGGMRNTILYEGMHSTIGGGFLNFIADDAGTATVGGGRENTIAGDAGTISGGWGNTAAAYVFIGGGFNNVATEVFSTISGGTSNTNLAERATIGGGNMNRIDEGTAAVIGGGIYNRINGTAATIAGGEENAALYDGATVSGGLFNSATAHSSTVGGGSDNQATGQSATVAGGNANQAGDGACTVGGGEFNRAFGSSATIAGGQENLVNGSYSTIAGGNENRVFSGYSTLGGGDANVISSNADYSTIGGGQGNNVSALAATIGGGEGNGISGPWATVGGGYGNFSAGEMGAIAGGANNSASGEFSFIGGGYFNGGHGNYAAVGGGFRNSVLADANFSTIGGGASNAIRFDAVYATIGGGTSNAIGEDSDAATIGGGEGNSIASSCEYAFIGGGKDNRIEKDGGYFATISGGLANTNRGYYASIPGGRENLAERDYTLAAGRKAQARHEGAFVWADASNFNFASSNQNEFAARAVGGVRFVTAIDGSGSNIAGVSLAPGSGTWASLSDRDAKENFSPADARKILEKVAALPLATWNYKSQDRFIRHIGPMAQDFHSAFAVGENDRTITTVDADGVALAAIQGLNEKVNEENRALRAALQTRDAEIQELKKGLAELRDLIGNR